jgi:type III pantothenate kinase
MILTMDIGNTNIKTALFDGKEMYKYWRMSTSTTSTSDEYGVRLSSMFAHEGVPTSVVDGIVVSSVVPTINFTIDHMLQNYFGKAPLFVAPGVKTGINIRYENPRELGSDRIANAVAAYDEYGGPCIFIDFGTATTFGVIDAGGAFLGGTICPGIKLSSEALVSGTAKLPRFELARPENVIGRTTLTNLQSGMFYGYVGLVRNIVRKIKQELGKEAYVVATGGMALMIAEESNVIDKLDGLLTLKGLRLIYERNSTEGGK